MTKITARTKIATFADHNGTWNTIEWKYLAQAIKTHLGKDVLDEVRANLESYGTAKWYALGGESRIKAVVEG